MTPKLLRLRGAGGKKPKSPTYTNDNLFSEDSIELLLGVGEGPIQGLENGAQSFFVGGVPLERVEGASTIKNFANLIINPNALNDTGQGVNYHNGFPEGIAHDVVFQKGGTSASVEVGTQVLYSTPVIRYTPSNMRGRIKKLEVRVNIAQLGIEDNNGTRNNTAKFRIEYKTSDPNSLWTILDAAYSFPLLPAAKSLAVVSSSRDGQNEYQLEGKTGSGFIIDFTIPANPLAILPPQFEQDWMLRITKNSPDYIDGSSGNATKEIAEIIFDSFQMIGDARMDFPNTAVIHVLGTASDQFSSLPDFYGIYKGLKTPVPAGYDTTLANPHQFVTWTGALENKYHSNPAWVLYDLLNNERYGYRKYVSDLNLNKQDFYEAGVWCDSQVVGKNGSPERRYTMNITIAENQNCLGLPAKYRRSFRRYSLRRW
jgi:predicted phage tail protein